MRLKNTLVIIGVVCAVAFVSLALSFVLTQQGLSRSMGNPVSFFGFSDGILQTMFFAFLFIAISATTITVILLAKSHSIFPGRAKSLKKNEMPVPSQTSQKQAAENMLAETMQLKAELETVVLEAQKVITSKNNFLVDLSQKMHTPLNAIIGSTENALGKEGMETEVKDGIGKIHESSAELLGIINNIIDISSIESGKLVLNQCEYSTENLICEIVSHNIVQAQKKRISFLLTVDETLPKNIVGDAVHVKHIFDNVLSNAIEHTHSGSVEWVVAHETHDDGLWLVSYIKNSCTGIDQESQNADLGLVLAKSLAGMMGGTLSMKKDPNKGTTFSLRLHQKMASETPIGKVTADALMHRSFVPVNQTLHKNDEICGLDKVAGIACFGDDEDTYMQVLQSYAKNTRILLGNLEKSMTSGNFADYVVAIHGIKGSSLCIGALQAGRDAEQLESLAKAENAETMVAKNNAFVAYMERLLDSIDASVAAYQAEKKEKIALVA
jgi:signal transduction histidine kinase/HPt (histidine-containing phosphotransfer) domain-containing protein